MDVQHAAALARETADSLLRIGVAEVTKDVAAHDQIRFPSAQLLQLDMLVTVDSARGFARIVRLDVATVRIAFRKFLRPPARSGADIRESLDVEADVMAECDDERHFVPLHLRRDDGRLRLVIVPAIIAGVEMFFAAPRKAFQAGISL